MPRLVVGLRLRTPRERVRVKVDRLHARLTANNEFLAAADWFGAHEVTHYQSSAGLEFLLNREAWAFLADVRPVGDSVALEVAVSGQMHVWHDIDDAEEVHAWPRPKRQEWTLLAIDDTDLRIFIPRSEWLTRVVEPVNRTEFLVYELETKVADATPGLRTALGHLQRARRHYVEGHDAEALGACYSAMEALPGAPKSIVSAIGDVDKRKHVDALIRAIKDYCHAGRHVSKSEDRAGTFSAEHVDARCAIGLTTVLLTHIGTIR